MWKKIAFILLIAFIAIQFFRPEKNQSGVDTYHMNTSYPMNQELGAIFRNACFNCHSNRTHYPWYSNIQPVAWWLANHVEEGKEHLNFSTFAQESLDDRVHQFEEIIETVKEKEMPIPSYTWLGLHPEARLTDAQRQLIIDYCTVNIQKTKGLYEY